MAALKGEKKTMKKPLPLKKIIIKPELEPMADRLESGAQLLLDQMPDYVDQLVTDIATQAIIPKWQLLGGILFEAYNNGYLSSYTLDPAWKDGFKILESECKFCHEVFMPIRIGQLFCCNECGQGRAKIGEESVEAKESKRSKNELDGINLDSNKLTSSTPNPIPDSKSGKSGKNNASGWIEETLD
jgi:hypothetical protein